VYLFLVVSSCASIDFLIKRKEKKKKINNNLAIFGCVMTPPPFQDSLSQGLFL